MIFLTICWSGAVSAADIHIHTKAIAGRSNKMNTKVPGIPVFWGKLVSQSNALLMWLGFEMALEMEWIRPGRGNVDNVNIDDIDIIKGNIWDDYNYWYLHAITFWLSVILVALTIVIITLIQLFIVSELQFQVPELYILIIMVLFSSKAYSKIDKPDGLQRICQMQKLGSTGRKDGVSCTKHQDSDCIT